MDSILEKPQSDAVAQKYHVLIVEDSDGKRSIPLNAATYSLGRDPSNTIPLNDRAASRHHLILIRVSCPNQEFIYRVIDGDANGKASLNGICVNGVPCMKRDLETGDTIEVGKTTKIQYVVKTWTHEEFQWHFERDTIVDPANSDFSSDPVMTMTTILSC